MDTAVQVVMLQVVACSELTFVLAGWLQETFAGMIRRAGFSYVSYDNIQNGVVAMHSGFKMLGAA